MRRLQVGLIAINVIGHGGYEDAPIAAGPIAAGRPIPTNASGGAAAGVHDLAVDMGMDPETAALLRDVNRRKEAAVAAEEYELVRVYRA